MKTIVARLVACVVAALPLAAAESQTAAYNTFSVTLPPPRFAGDLRPDSPFGINTAFQICKIP